MPLRDQLKLKSGETSVRVSSTHEDVQAKRDQVNQWTRERKGVEKAMKRM